MNIARDLPCPRPLPKMPAVVVIKYQNKAIGKRGMVEIDATERNLVRAKELGVDLLLLHGATMVSEWRPAA